MCEGFDTSLEPYRYRLGSTPDMETTVLAMLSRLEVEGHSDELDRRFAHHAEETRQQIANIEQAFVALGTGPTTSLPGDRGDGQRAPGGHQAGRRRAPRRGHPGGSRATESYEIAVYERPLGEAEAMGKVEVAGLLRRNLGQVQEPPEEVRAAMRSLAERGA
jgi:ferritin-like metal-binding protein YciE